MARIKIFDTNTQSWVYADKSFGKDGKNAYEYAQEGGYSGSETEFYSDLANHVTSVNGSTGEVTINAVPSCTTSNNGQFLRVVDGIATWSTIPNAEEATFGV